ncbi:MULTISPECIES: histidine utilization repressor [Rhodopseudomonas]|uniref:Histidine utilization repressor n=1 Tax=Rhodopseudomonas palustris TaxID=1076 RepID=A0A0D7F4C2_RHOPL|nr:MULTISPECIES: histidine utilization repressor [Rhodopseudomonas]KIZ47665.1 GntR family transcriptional regulator [Rhodopseudomonas palustris]MDF3808868.1 histidine utilization repressor [Rhodopseudomonas sp. BAL398]WOK19834.1 histidine utilization repressor [Rhodopseudomonas sp. BAL398]
MTAKLKAGAKIAPKALYQRIRCDLEAKITSGDWPPGHRVPFEHELMETYSCSRMTVNKVISALAEAGLVVRRRRAGSFVSRPRVQSAILQIPDLKGEVEKRGERYGFRLIELHQRRPTAADRARIAVGAGTRLLAIRCLHEAQGQPFAIEDRLINLQAVPDALRVDFSITPPNTWLVGHVPWTEAEHRITACNADQRLAEDLKIDLGAACLVIERRTWRTGEPITAVRITHPGHLYDLIARFTPTG